MDELLKEIASLTSTQFTGIWFAWLCAVCTAAMVIFERLFAEYLPKPRFRAPRLVQFTAVAAMACGLLGLTTGILQVYELPTGGLGRWGSLQLTLLIGGGFLLVLAGWRVWRGGVLAALVVVALPLLDISWNLLRYGLGVLATMPARFIVELLIAALGVACISIIPRRWAALRYEETESETIHVFR